MNNNEIMFAWSKINFETGLLDPYSITFDTNTLDSIMKIIKDSKKGKTSICALIYPGDIKGKSSPVNKDISFDDFAKDPCKYGVSVYKTWNNKIVID